MVKLIWKKNHLNILIMYLGMKNLTNKKKSFQKYFWK
jgi:hypothetical protein